MEDNTKEFDRFVKERNTPAEKNTLYKMLVEGMFAECEGILDKQVLDNMKSDSLNILLNLVKYTFASGVVEGFKSGFDVSEEYVPIIRKQSEKSGHRKISSNGGYKNSSIYDPQREIAENTYIIFKQDFPELIEMYKFNPKKDKPKTELKKRIADALGYNSLADRTLSNWAKKLLENDGILKIRM